MSPQPPSPPTPPLRRPPRSHPPSAAAAPTRKTKVRSFIWAGAFTAIIITGTLYGAQLGRQRDVQKAQKVVREATTQERIEMLQRRRAYLVGQKIPLEQKLARLEDRMRDKAMAEGGVAAVEALGLREREEGKGDKKDGKEKEEEKKASTTRPIRWFG